MKLPGFLSRLLIFVGLFIVVSGVIGSWVVPTRLLYGFEFYIYGNMGKMVILSMVMFGLLTKDKLGAIKIQPWSKYNLAYLAGVVVLIPVFFGLASLLLSYQSFESNIFLSLLTHLVLLLIPLLLLVGIFGAKFLVTFVKQFARELKICLLLSIAFYLAIFQVWKLWPLFSNGVLNAVKFLLSLTFANVEFTEPLTLTVNDFSVSILQACSGLDSLFMFSALYAFIGILDHKKFQIKKLLAFYPIAALGMYLVNIARVYMLIVIGATISPELALRLFHTYAGMILFVIYFGLFWKLAYRRILKS